MIRRQLNCEFRCGMQLLRDSARLFCSKTSELPPEDAEISAKSKHRRNFFRQSQGLRAFRPEECPENPTIVLFPGQGSQFVGMAKSVADMPEAKHMFDLASDILRLYRHRFHPNFNLFNLRTLFLHRYDLLKLCNEGPEYKLNETAHCQPAIMVTSLASLELLKKHRKDAIQSCVGTAGFSLGELTSLVFAGALPFDQSRLIRTKRFWYEHKFTQFYILHSYRVGQSAG